MIGIAGLVGGAIFVLTGPAIGLAGPAAIIAFIINAVITLFTAMGYAELGSAMPEAGGGYLWVREGLPRPNAFISGWMAWFAHIVAGSLYSVGFGSFLFSLLKMIHILGNQPLLGIIPFDKLIAVASIAAFTYQHQRGFGHRQNWNHSYSISAWDYSHPNRCRFLGNTYTSKLARKFCRFYAKRARWNCCRYGFDIYCI
jgi:amino acid transporter